MHIAFIWFLTPQSLVTRLFDSLMGRKISVVGGQGR